MWLTHSVVLISTAQQSDSVTHIYTFEKKFFSTVVYPRTLRIVLCALQLDLVVYPFCM